MVRKLTAGTRKRVGAFRALAIGRRKLADFPFAKSRSGLSIRVGIASAVVVVGLGIFIDSLPPACRAAGSDRCGPGGAALDVHPTADQRAPAPATTHVAEQQVAAAPAARQQPEGASHHPANTPLAEGLIAKTFAQLGMSAAASAPEAALTSAQPEPAPSSLQPALARSEEAAAARGQPVPRAPTIRTVRTRAVGADGTIADLAPAPLPVADQVMAERAAPKSEPPPAPKAAPADSSATPAAQAPSSAPSPEPAATKQTAVQPAPPPKQPVRPTTTPTNVMVVGGAGVNVRAGPSKSRGQVVFKLAAGQRVTVLREQRGWVFVADAKGRRGWIYGRFLHPAKS